MSHPNRSSGTLLFTDDDLAKAFQDRIHVSPARSSPNRSPMAVHDVSDPNSPWKRSIRVKYSDVNMRDSNSMALQEASDLLARDMASYVSLLLGRHFPYLSVARLTCCCLGVWDRTDGR